MYPFLSEHLKIYAGMFHIYPIQSVMNLSLYSPTIRQKKSLNFKACKKNDYQIFFNFASFYSLFVSSLILLHSIMFCQCIGSSRVICQVFGNGGSQCQMFQSLTDFSAIIVGKAICNMSGKTNDLHQKSKNYAAILYSLNQILLKGPHSLALGHRLG